jgi:uncharacterized protein (TIGR03066 family)
MRVHRLFVICAVLCLAAPGAQAQEKKGKVDKAKLLVGSWETAKADEGTLPKGAIVQFTKDGKLIVTINQDGKEMKMEGTYKLDGDSFDMALKVGDMEHKDTIKITKLTAKELKTENSQKQVVEFTRKK